MYYIHYLCGVKLLKLYQTTTISIVKMEIKELRKLKTNTLAGALREMNVGETCLAPDGYHVKSVLKTCVELKGEGFLFLTSTRSGQQTITRLR